MLFSKEKTPKGNSQYVNANNVRAIDNKERIYLAVSYDRENWNKYRL